MRVLFTSDLHGRAVLYDQLADQLRAASPDLLILGGDLFADGDPADPAGTQVAYIRQVFLPRVAAWRRSAPDLTVACVQGNHDWLCSRAVLQDEDAAGRMALLDHQHVWRHGGFNFLGYSHTPPTPFWVKDLERLDLPGDRAPAAGGMTWDADAGRARELLPAELTAWPSIAQELAGATAVEAPWVFVCHAPPYGTKLDRLPGIEHPIGSRAVRTFIEQRRPFLALHGHIHESPGLTGGFVDRVGGTLCVNPGQLHDRLCAVRFDLERPETTLRHTVYA